MDIIAQEDRDKRRISGWLLCILLLVIAMIGLGAITRLTRSGLSIVEWKPIVGTLPPLSEEAWQNEFLQYQNFPEFQKINSTMTLQEFKGIYFWEYLHRLLGRIIGVVILIPLGIFIWRRKISRDLARRIAGLFVLGGLQGYIGWIMVKSGLEDNPHVSHYKLAMHLGMAMLLIMYLIYIINLLKPQMSALKQNLFSENRGVLSTLGTMSWMIVALILLQIFYGALVAGLKAGFAYNTFPLMNGQWIPEGIWGLSPAWLNIFENHALVQWIHRFLGIAVAFFILVFYVGLEMSGVEPSIKKIGRILSIAIILQLALGILTLIYVIPVFVATMHQVMGVICLILSFQLALSLTSSRGYQISYLFKS